MRPVGFGGRATQEVPWDPYASTEDVVPNRGPLDVVRAVGEAPLEIAVELTFSARLTNAAPRKIKGLGRLALNSPVISMKWEQPSLVMPIPGFNTAQSIIDCWIPFN